MTRNSRNAHRTMTTARMMFLTISHVAVLLPGFIADRCNGASLVARRMIGYEEEITIGAVRKKDNTDPLLRRFLEICMTTLHR